MIEISSDMAELPKVNEYVASLKEQFLFSDDIYSAIELTVNEATTNAIMHGNQMDPSKKVIIDSKRINSVLEVSVEDQGTGFDPSNLPDPTDEINLLNSGGRGIFIIRAYADAVRFENEGRKIVLSFHI